MGAVWVGWNIVVILLALLLLPNLPSVLIVWSVSRSERKTSCYNAFALTSRVRLDSTNRVQLLFLFFTTLFSLTYLLKSNR
jgi:hypothetical protein